MNNYTLESFITFCDDMQIAEEGTSSSNVIKFKMFGKDATAKIIFDNVEDTPSTRKIINSVLKLVGSNKSLYTYLYTQNKSLYDDEINKNPYFDGKTIQNGIDLLKAMTNDTRYTLVVTEKTVYFCGEYWIDPEHGFSISFPNGKFVKAEKESRMTDIRNKYRTEITVLGQFSDAL